METEQTTTLEQLLSPLDEILEELEESRVKHHREVLSLTHFVRLVVYYFVSNLNSARQLVTDTESADENLELLNVKRSTLSDAFDRFPSQWFGRMLRVVLEGFAWQTIPEVAALGRLYLVDGSLFPALKSMCWAKYKANSPAIKLHLCLELNRMLPVHFLVGDGNSNERDALRQMVEAGATYIADRGYVCFKLLAEIVNSQAHFVIRMRNNLDYTPIETMTVSLPNSLSRFFSAVTDQIVQLNGAKGMPHYRLVTFKVAQEQYFILTDRRDLTTLQVIMLYAYRWQIELMFRFLKHPMHGLHLISTSPQGITIQFYLLLITALLELRLKQQCVIYTEQQEQQTSYHGSSSLSPIPVPSPTPVSVSTRPPIESNFEKSFSRSSSSRGQTFMNTIGKKLHSYWKISVHWIIHLRNCLAKPFDMQTVSLLGRTS